MDSINQGSKIFGKRMGGMVQVIEQVQGPEFNPRYSTKKYRGKNCIWGWLWLYTPVIPATWEEEIRENS
jgi:hypothetical protein